MGKLLHSGKIAADFREFLDQLQVTTTAHLDAALPDGHLKHVFKCATAAHTVFRSFEQKTRDPLLAATSGIARRVAILAMLRQLALARIELRRMIECVNWHVYFVDHPIERRLFLTEPSTRPSVDDPRDDPLMAGAFSGPGYYRAYVKGLMKLDPSGHGEKAAAALSTAYAELSLEVHPARGAVHPSGTLALAADRYDAPAAAKLGEDVKTVLSNAVVLVSASDGALIGNLDAIDREWFDWLIGRDCAKVIRSSPFGISR